ncbi:ras GEF [Rickenella mellea]|uniref:Ras GEF n=1 Tax=Rickenella mellea TaxID=50990 RepID=A0A4Y7QNJ8_9AGAM|nr:ras GEF [Rickenella mellea]
MADSAAQAPPSESSIASDSVHSPSLPRLPPIQMPKSSQPISAVDNSLREQDDDTSASWESFATAFTSTSATRKSPLAGHSHDPPSSHTLSTPRSLRKSTSVDSFIKFKDDQHRHLHTLEHHWNAPSSSRGDSAIDPGMHERRPQAELNSSKPTASHSLLERIRPPKGRQRGSSLSVSGDDTNDSFFEDSDMDRASDVARRREGGRRRLSKTKRPGSTVPQPGELALPPRLRAQGSNASASSLPDTSGITKRLRQNSSGFSSSTSANSLPTRDRNTTPTPDTILGRRRSGSLGVQTALTNGSKAHISKRMKVNTDIRQRHEQFTLVVVGFHGCGKSSFIRKSLKHYRLSDAEICEVTVGPDKISYVSRVANNSDSTPTSERTITMLEFDTQSLNVIGQNAWPSLLQNVDGVFVCYDATDAPSFEPVRDILAVYNKLKVPTMVLACKSDLAKAVSPEEALKKVQHFAGIVEVSNRTENGKSKMRKCVDHLIRAIVKDKSSSRTSAIHWHNPASPTVTATPQIPWENATSIPAVLTATSSLSSIPPSTETTGPSNAGHVTPGSPLTRSPSAPTSPTRARSTSDLLSEHQRHVASVKHVEREREAERMSMHRATTSDLTSQDEGALVTEPERIQQDGLAEDRREHKQKDLPPSPWATLEELLDKLFFLSVSGDDPSFISHFFLTYRRFSTPRSVLLGMQKRMIELSQPSDDFMLASYAQMRICNLLENWMKEYPSDFAVTGASGALSALTKQTLSHTHTLHYGSDFLPFIEMLPNQVDQDASWALKVEDNSTESDESDGIFDDDHESDTTEVESPTSVSHGTIGTSSSTIADSSPFDPTASGRERKSSLPLAAKSMLHAPSSSSNPRNHLRPTVNGKTPTRDLLTKLLRIANHVLNVEAAEIANEITRVEADLFLKIEPRHWLRHTLVPGKKNPDSDPIAKFHASYNHVHDWAVSLILCHDKPKQRARQIEKFAEVACKLRALNNYSGLRAIVTAISNSTYPGDLPMEMFKAKTELYKKFRSSDILLHSTGSYRSYRLALRNTKGPCIPALEVHMSDLLRAHEGNPDFKADDPTKIHWGKFNMIGKFIGSTTQYQAQCRDPNEYNFTENKFVQDLLRVETLDYETQQARINAPADYDGVDPYGSPVATMSPQDNHKDIGGFRRLFFR